MTLRRLLQLAGLALLCAHADAVLNPGDVAAGFVVPTLAGPLAVPGRGGKTLPLVVFLYDPADPFSKYMWIGPDSLTGFLQLAPDAVSFLFASYGEATAEADARFMRDQLARAAAALRLPLGRLAALWRRLHFATVPASQLPGWLPGLLADWPRVQRVAQFAVAPPNGQAWNLTSGRIDSWYGWLPSGWSKGAVPLALAGADCAWVPPPGAAPNPALKGAAAVVKLSQLPSTLMAAPCSYVQIMKALADAGAAAVVLVAPPGGYAAPANCTGGGPRSPLNSMNACDELAGQVYETGLLTTMVPWSEGVAGVLGALRAGAAATANFSDVAAPSLMFGIDAQQRLFEMGWLKLPTLLNAAWGAQNQIYRRHLAARLAEPALVLPVFANQPFVRDAGAQAAVALPPRRQLAQYNRLHLDFMLGCPGSRDADCPVWDHVVQLFVCCPDASGSTAACDPCQRTAWRRRSLLFSPAIAAAELAAAGRGAQVAAGAPSVAVCGRELGRWVTPFKRRNGHWLSDVTPLMPLLAPGRQCTFTVQSAPWAGTWTANLNLRFSRAGGTAASSGGGLHPRPLPAPSALLPLPFNGGEFNATYNQRWQPFTFVTPPRLLRAAVESVISGHGSDQYGCGEFCVTQHVFVINGRRHTLNLGPSPGNYYGCTTTQELMLGTTPNEHGTWSLGRGGWCNGRDVKQWVADITASMAPAGRPNTLTYAGLFNGSDPRPDQKGGAIMMQGNLALWTS